MSYLVPLLALLLVWLFFIHCRSRQESRRVIQGLRREKEEEAARCHERYLRRRQGFLDALEDCFFTVSSQGRILLANQTTRAIFGERTLVGRSIEEALLHSELIKPIRESLDTHSPRKLRLTLPKNAIPSQKAGHQTESHWELETILVPAEGEEQHYLVVLRDISRGIHTDQIRKDFVANASHELRTPLTIISGYLENLLEDDLLDERDSAEYLLTTMQKHVERLNRIVEDMLVISRLESGLENTLKLSTFSLSECIKDVT
ncbi:MAG: histidine kinase dimerization/phospho-acceptor domain-containing protein, partial [Verrucomicrobiales bacterium]